MKFQTSDQFKRYLTKLIKEEKEAMDSQAGFDDFDDFEDDMPADDEMMMSDLEKGSSGGYGAGYSNGDPDRPMADEEVVEEAYIPASYFRKSMISESARKNNKSANIIAKAYTAFVDGRITESRAVRAICRVTETLPSNTFVKKGQKSVRLRRFLRASK